MQKRGSQSLDIRPAHAVSNTQLQVGSVADNTHMVRIAAASGAPRAEKMLINTWDLQNLQTSTVHLYNSTATIA